MGGHSRIGRSVVAVCVLSLVLVSVQGAHAAPPSNDSFSTPFILGNGSGSTPATNVEATKELPDEPDHAGEPGGASVWFTWTAPQDGVLMADTCNTEQVDPNLDTVLAVYSGLILSDLDELGGDDDACGLQSSVEVPVVGGEEYRIAVDGVDAEEGTFRLQYGLQPANDDFAAAEAIDGPSGSVAGQVFRASHELGEPDHAGDPGFGSLWYRWTAPSSVLVTLHTCSTPDDTLLAVYTGAAVGSLTLVAGNDDSPDCLSLGSRVEFEAVGGTTYSIAVDSLDWFGSFSLSWSLDFRPRNVIPPQIAGRPVEGSVVTVSQGTWLRASSLSYEWFQCVNGSCTLIPGASSRALQVTAALIGRQLFARVTGINPSGSARADSQPTGRVWYAPPANVVPPSIRGLARVGSQLVADPGTWRTGSAPPTGASFRWQRCDPGGQSCVDSRSTGLIPRYLVGANDRNSTIRVVVSMNSMGGLTSVASPRTAVVPYTCGVPNLVGKGIPAARRLTSRLSCKFRVVVSGRAWSARRRGVIVKQRPRPSTQLGRGARIRVVVSRGRRR